MALVVVLCELLVLYNTKLMASLLFKTKRYTFLSSGPTLIILKASRNYICLVKVLIFEIPIILSVHGEQLPFMENSNQQNCGNSYCCSAALSV